MVFVLKCFGIFAFMSITGLENSVSAQYRSQMSVLNRKLDLIKRKVENDIDDLQNEIFDIKIEMEFMKEQNVAPPNSSFDVHKAVGELVLLWFKPN